MKTCWNCGATASTGIPEYANDFCQSCADIFREELKKEQNYRLQMEEMEKSTGGGYY